MRSLLFGSLRGYKSSWLSGDVVAVAATVGEFATQGGKQFVAMTAALAITTGLAALVAGLARLGFLATSSPSPC